MTLQHLDVHFDVKQISGSDPDFFFIEGLASTFGNMDQVDDIVQRGAFKESLARIMPKILWQHDSSEPIGMPDEIRETDEGLFVRIKLPKADTFVSGRVMPQVRVGSINSMSIGFVIESPEDIEREGDIRLLKKILLKEISLVSFPANEMALVSGFKSSDNEDESKTVTPFQSGLPIAARDRVWDAAAAIGRVRTSTGSIDAPSASYRRNFMWFDSSEPDKFGSYKLPFVDVIDGTRTAIPRAINNAKARLNQTDIPAADKARILSNINRYQDKFEKPKSTFDSIEVKEMGKRELEGILRDSGYFSKSAAVYIASQLPGDPAQEPMDVSTAFDDMLSKTDDFLINEAMNKLLR